MHYVCLTQALSIREDVDADAFLDL